MLACRKGDMGGVLRLLEMNVDVDVSMKRNAGYIMLFISIWITLYTRAYIGIFAHLHISNLYTMYDLLV